MTAAATGASDTSPCARPRRRGAALEDAIHCAVFEELADVGYPAFTIESVAARAKIGKSSIYRRWQTKQDLVVDSFVARFGGPDDIVAIMADSGASTRDLLVEVGTHICLLSGEAGEAMRAIAFETTRDPELAATIEKKVGEPKRSALIEILRRGVLRGEVRHDAACEFYGELLPAVIIYRTVMVNRPVTTEDVADVVDRAIMPLLRPA